MDGIEQCNLVMLLSTTQEATMWRYFIFISNFIGYQYSLIFYRSIYTLQKKNTVNGETQVKVDCMIRGYRIVNQVKVYSPEEEITSNTFTVQVGMWSSVP